MPLKGFYSDLRLVPDRIWNRSLQRFILYLSAQFLMSISMSSQSCQKSYNTLNILSSTLVSMTELGDPHPLRSILKTFRYRWNIFYKEFARIQTIAVSIPCQPPKDSSSFLKKGSSLSCLDSEVLSISSDIYLSRSSNSSVLNNLLSQKVSAYWSYLVSRGYKFMILFRLRVSSCRLEQILMNRNMLLNTYEVKVRHPGISIHSFSSPLYDVLEYSAICLNSSPICSSSYFWLNTPQPGTTIFNQQSVSISSKLLRYSECSMMDFKTGMPWRDSTTGLFLSFTLSLKRLSVLQMSMRWK